MIDKDLLYNIVAIQATSTEDSEINKYIVDSLKKIQNVKVEKDAFGNIYATKGNGKNGYKCIVAHTDTVHSMESNRKIFVHGDILFAMADNKYESKYYSSSSQIKQVGIGGDDKAGIYACLKAMQDFDDIKSVYFRFEETGCRGSSASNIKFFDDCNFVVQCDRKGSDDFITFTNGITIASEEFKKKMEPINLKYGFSSNNGSSTDVGMLKKKGLKVSACNISSGYYDPHYSYETINMLALDNTYQMVSEMFKQYGNTRFEHEYVMPKSTYIPRVIGNLFSRGLFSTTLDNNYFSDNIMMDEISDAFIQGGPVLFEKIGQTNMYKYIGDLIIDIPGTCKECGVHEKIVYLTDSREFYCTGDTHTGEVSSPEAYRHCKIEENGIVYVYNSIYDVWIPENESIWDVELNTYFSSIF